MNAYLYCYNDGINYFDASGAKPEVVRNNTTVDPGGGGSKQDGIISVKAIFVEKPSVSDELKKKGINTDRLSETQQKIIAEGQEKLGRLYKEKNLTVQSYNKIMATTCGSLLKTTNNKVQYEIFSTNSEKSSNFSNQAEWLRKKAVGENLLPILMPADSKAEFVDAWNSMGLIAFGDEKVQYDLEKVYIIMHSNGQSLIMEEGNSTVPRGRFC